MVWRSGKRRRMGFSIRGTAFRLILLLVVVLQFSSYPCDASSSKANEKWIAFAKHLRKKPITAQDLIDRVKRQAADVTPVPPEIVRFHVESRIAVRFASTTIRAYIRNPASDRQSVSFDLLLPLNSYITDFNMNVDGERYQGYAIDRCLVSDLSQPADVSISSLEKMEYTTGGQQTRNLFTVTVDTVPRGNVQLMIQYQELLERQNGWYTQRISVRPSQSVYDFRIYSTVTEPQGIERSEAGIDTRSYTESVSSLLTDSMAGLHRSTASNDRGKVYDLGGHLRNTRTSGTGTTQCQIDYRPTQQQQDGYMNRYNIPGIYGDFIIRYDIAHPPGVGEVQTSGTNFIHRFAPANFGAVNKRVVFVLDFSASMYGNKIKQTKEAMYTILDEMNDRDHFNILPFSDYVYDDWNRGRMVDVNPYNINHAKHFIRELDIQRGTNLNDALLEGLSLLETTGSMNSTISNPMVCILFVLTDGKPSVGVTSLSAIERNVRNANDQRCSIVTLGFGKLVNYNFLVRLALQNRGMARRIYEDSSAPGQLRGVYSEVATPLLFNIVVEYLNNAVRPGSTSATTFPNYFNGSELAVSGILSSDDLRYLPIKITAVGADGVTTFKEDVNLRNARLSLMQNPQTVNDHTIPSNFVERTYAFMTLRELFNRYRLADDAVERRSIAERARVISRRYNLLTPLMSMVLSRVADPGEEGDDWVSVTRIVESRPSGFEWSMVGPSFGRVGEMAAGIGGANCDPRPVEPPPTRPRTRPPPTTTEPPPTNPPRTWPPRTWPPRTWPPRPTTTEAPRTRPPPRTWPPRTRPTTTEAPRTWPPRTLPPRTRPTTTEAPRTRPPPRTWPPRTRPTTTEAPRTRPPPRTWPPRTWPPRTRPTTTEAPRTRPPPRTWPPITWPPRPRYTTTEAPRTRPPPRTWPPRPRSTTTEAPRTRPQPRTTTNAPAVRRVDNPIVLRRYNVESDTTERYARTKVEAEYENVDYEDHPIEFSQQIPSGAYVSDFYVDIDGERYRGVVQNIRDGRWRDVFATSSSGQVLAVLARRDPTKDAFVMQLPEVRPNGRATFVLTYDELLKRVRGQYEQRINIAPHQLVEDLGIDVQVTEPQRIREMTAEYDGDTRTGRHTLNLATGITQDSDTRSQFRFYPTVYDQSYYNENGLDGDIVIKYDVERTPDGSHLQVQDNHFVHFFSPSELDALKKQIVFVIDVSASMYGTKLSQTKEALKTMLDRLNPRDYFSIITFSDGVRYWKGNSRLAPAIPRYIEEAKSYVDSLRDDSETNLNEAILRADELLDSETVYNRPGDEYLSMIILLTDGIPSVGVTDPQEILDNAREAIAGEHSLYTLGFGRLADFDLLVKLAYENNGIARMIYEDSSATEQLRDFYLELYRPLLFDVSMEYPGGVVNPDTLTERRFPVYFDGSELVIAGRLDDNPPSNYLRGVIDSISTDGPDQTRVNSDIRRTSPELSYHRTVPNVVERIWVMKRLEDLIDMYARSRDPIERDDIAERIIVLAKRYNLVTPLTPLALRHPRTGDVIDGSNSDDVPLPGYSLANSARDLLKEAIGKNGPTTAPVKLQDAPLAMENDENINIVLFNVMSLIILRYAITTVEVEMQNEGRVPGHAVFKQKLPEDAFISNLTITVNGEVYTSEVTDPQDTAGLGLGKLEIGRSGGILSPLGDLENNLLVIAVPVEPGERAYFRLTYERKLPRRLGLYEQKIGIFPEQVVEVMNLDTIIIEPQGLSRLDSYLLDQSDASNPISLARSVQKRNSNRWEVHYSPRAREQMGVSPMGIMADYTVQYDVTHGNDAGDIQVLNDYFVQYFSPSGLSVLRKNIIFVIDISGSMSGTKLSQVKDALSTILDDMSETDKFNILPFSDDVHFLERSGMLYSTKENVRRAKRFVMGLQEMDNTNLHKAIISGVEMLRTESEQDPQDEEIVSMLIVLTDGNPNHGEIDKTIIERNVHEAINGDFSLFCIGFGADADYPFLRRLSLQNHGIARRIPERADAGEHLENFYYEVATPLLRDIEFRYSRGIEPNSLSDRTFSNYFNGSELTVVGKLLPNSPYDTLNSYVYGRTTNDPVTLRGHGNIQVPSRALIGEDVPEDIIERIWAYHIIQSLKNEQALAEESPDYSMIGDSEIKDKSVQYRFFNPSTALLISRDDQGSRRVNPFGMRVITSPLPRTARKTLSRNYTVIPPAPIPAPEPLSAGFTIAVPKVEITVCLDEDPQDNDVIALLEDPLQGIFVNGRIVGDTVSGRFGDRDRTYIGEIAIVLNSPQPSRHRLKFNSGGIAVDSSRPLRWGITSAYTFGAHSLEVNGLHVVVSLANGARFEIMSKRLDSNTDRHRPDAFTFNVLDNTGLTSSVDGIIGRFQHASVMLDQPNQQLSSRSSAGCGLSLSRSRAVSVNLTWRKNGLAGARDVCEALGSDTLSNNINGLQYTDFRRASLYSTV
ncbi:uncharacterized protein LOC129255898 [Lytechinus pictus]|uniref:uncharacterized protein LOC129255898 n=1 Tax=Lytechinus pictus TaxID=7653 RepID=UPI0030B9DD13